LVVNAAIADACAVIVFLSDPCAAQVMPSAYPTMAGGTVYVPDTVVWEISRKVRIGKLPPIGRSLPELLTSQGFSFLSLTWEIAEAAEKLPAIHNDPFDRILVAHALAAGLPILTSDREIPKYGARSIW
jgi:PIN domain nuclease of toxin-antitoxin system